MTDEEQRSIRLLVSGETSHGCAEILGVPETQIQAWLERSDYRQALLQAAGAAQTAAVARLSGMVPEALDTLSYITRGGEATAVQLKAATYVLDSALAVFKVLSQETESQQQSYHPTVQIMMADSKLLG